MLTRVRHSYLKNRDEIQALLTGRMPSYIYGARKFRDIPVFCFHSARYPAFELQLRFLKENGYRTLDADELCERLSDTAYRNDGKEIALTFDDGMASVWTVAFPLLKKYEFKMISFILPGLIDESNEPGPTIEGASEEEKEAIASRDYSEKPLCNWQEIRIMHESGLVDFQSHGMHHALIAISQKIVDFIHPGFDAYHYGNIHIPLYRDAEGRDVRDWVPGHPVYESAPRMSGKTRYLDPFELRDICAKHVALHDGNVFFSRKAWRKELHEIAKKYQKEHFDECNRYERDDEKHASMWHELHDSKKLIESKLGKAVHHFCFPWFSFCDESISLASEAGYRSVHLGAMKPQFTQRRPNEPVMVVRLQEEYLHALPGKGRHTLTRVLMSKLR